MGALTADSVALPVTAHPRLLTLVLQDIHRAIATFLIKQAGLKRSEAQTGAITLIQRFGSAANLNIHMHCLVLDSVYRIQNGVAEFCSVRPPAAEQSSRVGTFLRPRGQRQSYPSTALSIATAQSCAYTPSRT